MFKCLTIPYFVSTLMLLSAATANAQDGDETFDETEDTDELESTEEAVDPLVVEDLAADPDAVKHGVGLRLRYILSRRH